MPFSRSITIRLEISAFRIRSGWTPSETPSPLRQSSCGSIGWSGDYSGIASPLVTVCGNCASTQGRVTGCTTDAPRSKPCCSYVAATSEHQKADIKLAKEYWKDHE